MIPGLTANPSKFGALTPLVAYIGAHTGGAILEKIKWELNDHNDERCNRC